MAQKRSALRSYLISSMTSANQNVSAGPRLDGLPMARSHERILDSSTWGMLGVLVIVSSVLLLLVVAIVTLSVDANQYSLEAVSPGTVIGDKLFALQNGDVIR